MESCFSTHSPFKPHVNVDLLQQNDCTLETNEKEWEKNINYESIIKLLEN